MRPFPVGGRGLSPVLRHLMLREHIVHGHEVPFRTRARQRDRAEWASGGGEDEGAELPDNPQATADRAGLAGFPPFT